MVELYDTHMKSIQHTTGHKLNCQIEMLLVVFISQNLHLMRSMKSMHLLTA